VAGQYLLTEIELLDCRENPTSQAFLITNAVPQKHFNDLDVAMNAGFCKGRQPQLAVAFHEHFGVRHNKLTR
jgi:hypothetical protein